MTLPGKTKDDIIILNSKDFPFNHDAAVKALSFFIKNPDSYKNKKLLVIDHDSDYNPTWEELQELTDLVILLTKIVFSRIAFFTASDFKHGLGKIVKVLSEENLEQFRVFQSEQEAWDWLLVDK